MGDVLAKSRCVDFNHTDHEMTVKFTLSGPRSSGVRRYRLEASLTDSDEHASVVGFLVLHQG
jgi:hypothetical protein